MELISRIILSLIPLILFGALGWGQTLTLNEAIAQGTANYGKIKAKQRYAQASYERTERIKRDYLPNLSLSTQQSFGTVNGQNGPLYGFGGLGVASSGLPLPEQGWNSGFGALYLVNVNWEFFTFGRNKQRIALAKTDADQLERDYEQEVFQHKVKIAAAYLNLLAGRQLLISQEKNRERAEVFKNNIAARVKTGVLPGVDSMMAAAELSRTKITLNQIKEEVKARNNELVQLLSSDLKDFELDTTFLFAEPRRTDPTAFFGDSLRHPAKKYFVSRIRVSAEQEKLFKKDYWPSFSLFGVYQTRASGFHSNYAVDQTSFTRDYFEGIIPTRQNYLFGVGAVWNLTSILRAEKNVTYQRFVTEGLKEELKALDIELRSKEDAANARIAYAIRNFREAPLQVNAARQAYIQRLTLYNNGLTNLTDVITAQYTLNRAEIDQNIASVNVWQALLMKAAAAGDFNLFIDEF